MYKFPQGHDGGFSGSPNDKCGVFDSDMSSGNHSHQKKRIEYE